MATHFLPLSKNVSCTSTPQDKHLCQISWESVKNWGSSSRRKIAPARQTDRSSRPTDRPTNRRHADSYIYPLNNTLRVCGGITTIRSDALHLFLKVFYVYLSKMYTETAEISKKEDCEFCTYIFCTWATYKILNYKITVKCMFWRKYPFQDA